MCKGVMLCFLSYAVRWVICGLGFFSSWAAKVGSAKESCSIIWRDLGNLVKLSIGGMQRAGDLFMSHHCKSST